MASCAHMPTATAHYDRAELISRAQRAGSVREIFPAIPGPMRRLVDFAAAIWLATDPATSLPVAPTRAENLGAFRGLSGLAGREACRRVWELEFGFEDINLYPQLRRAQTPPAPPPARTRGPPPPRARLRA